MTAHADDLIYGVGLVCVDAYSGTPHLHVRTVDGERACMSLDNLREYHTERASCRDHSGTATGAARAAQDASLATLDDYRPDPNEV